MLPSPLEGWVPPSLFYCIVSPAPYRKTVGLQELCFVELQLDRLGPTSFFFLPLVLQNTCRCCFLIRDGTTFNTILGWPFTVFLGHEFGNLDLNLHRKDIFKTRAGVENKES